MNNPWAEKHVFLSSKAQSILCFCFVFTCMLAYGLHFVFQYVNLGVLTVYLKVLGNIR